MSKVTQLAAGQITRTDALSVELFKPSDAPAVILVRWPQAPSVLAPTPKAIANIAAALMRLLAEAQSKLAAIQRH